MKIILFLAIVSCFILAIPAYAQEKETRSEDIRLIKTQPSVYISFEREGLRKPFRTGDSNKGIWLRFHNNSKWQVGTCMFDVPKQYGDKDLSYEVESSKRLKGNEDTPVAGDPEGSCLLGFMKPGESILFSVPREHLAEGLAIKVMFQYEWDMDSDGFINDSEPKHFAYFYSSEIPK